MQPAKPDPSRLYDAPEDADTAALFRNDLGRLIAHNNGVLTRRATIRALLKGMRQAVAAGRVVAGYDAADDLDMPF